MFIAFAKYSVMEGRGGRQASGLGSRGASRGGNILYIQSHALKQNMGGAPFLIDNKRSLSRYSNISQSFFYKYKIVVAYSRICLNLQTMTHIRMKKVFSVVYSISEKSYFKRTRSKNKQTRFKLLLIADHQEALQTKTKTTTVLEF
jgi:hypothetical protein